MTSAVKKDIPLETFLFSEPNLETKRNDVLLSTQRNKQLNSQIPSIPDLGSDGQNISLLNHDQQNNGSPLRQPHSNSSPRKRFQIDKKQTLNGENKEFQRHGTFLQPSQLIQASSSNLNSQKLHSKSSIRLKNKNKSSSNFSVYIKTMKAMRSFKSFLIPKQIPQKAIKFIQDLSYYEIAGGNSSQVIKQSKFFSFNEKSNFLNVIKVIRINFYKVMMYLLKNLDQNFSVINPLNNLRLSFDMGLIFIIVLAVFFNTVEVFFAIEFKEVYPEAFPLTKQIFILIFIINILLNLNTGIYQKGSISVTRDEILKYYINNQFIKDIFAIISLLQYHPSLYYFGYLVRLFILVTIPQIVQKLNLVMQISLQSDSKIPHVIKLFKLFLTLMFVAHLVAIIFYGQTLIVNHIEYGQETWVSQSRILSEADRWSKKYIFSLYFSVTTMVTVGYGDITPVNNYEAVFVIISMVIAGGIFAYIFNLIGTIVSDMNKKKKLYKKKIQMLNIYLSNHNIEPDLRYQVQKYLEYKLKSDQKLSKEEEQKVLSDLSSNLLDRITFQAKKKILNKGINLFSIFSEEMRDIICLELKEAHPSKDEVIFETETIEEDPKMYFIHNGSVEISYKIAARKDQDGTVLRTLQEGSYFGEISLLTNQERQSSAKAKESSTLYSLSQSDLLRVLQTDKSELEKFHILKTKLMFNQSYTSIQSQCYYCQKDIHNINNCPMVHYCPNKQLIILKSKYSVSMKERKRFTRQQWKQCTLLDLTLKRQQALQLQENILESLILQDQENVNPIENQHAPPEFPLKKCITHTHLFQSQYAFQLATLHKFDKFGGPQLENEDVNHDEDSFSYHSQTHSHSHLQSEIYFPSAHYQKSMNNLFGTDCSSDSIPEECNHPQSLKVKSKPTQVMNSKVSLFFKINKKKDSNLLLIESENIPNDKPNKNDFQRKKRESEIERNCASSLYISASKNDSQDLRENEKRQHSMAKISSPQKKNEERRNRNTSFVKFKVQRFPPRRSTSPTKIFENGSALLTPNYLSIQNQIKISPISLYDYSKSYESSLLNPKDNQKIQINQSEGNQIQNTNPKPLFIKKSKQQILCHLENNNQVTQGLFSEETNSKKAQYQESLSFFDQMKEYKYYFPNYNFKNIIQQYNKIRNLQNIKFPSYFGVYSFVNRKDKKLKQKIMALGIKKIRLAGKE